MLSIATILAFMGIPAAYRPTAAPVVAPEVCPPDPRSIDGLIAWLETKKPSERYNWISTDSCLMAQYRDFIGRGYSSGSKCITLDNVIGTAPYIAVAMPRLGGRHTFGAALGRARAYKLEHRL